MGGRELEKKKKMKMKNKSQNMHQIDERNEQKKRGAIDRLATRREGRE